MEPITQTADQWAVLLPVIVGGAIAVLSGVVPAVISHFLTSRKERQTYRAARFEEMMDLAYQYDDWLTVNRSIVAFGEELEIGPAPLPKALTIATLYFPELVSALRGIASASSAYEIWMRQAGIKRLGGEIGSMNDGMMDAYRPYQKALNSFIHLATEYAAKRKGKV